MFHLFTRSVAFFRSIRWSRTDKIAAACLGAFLAIGFACTGCAALGNALGANTAQTANIATAPNPTATLRPTAKPRPTATPADTPTPRPTATPKPTATPRPTATLAAASTPILGGNISAFLRVYGPPTNQSNTQLGDYNLREYPGSYTDYLIVNTGDIVGDTSTEQYVAAILVQAPPNQLWSLSQAEQQCAPFLPDDAQHIKTWNPPVNGKAGDLDMVYISASLAQMFPAKDFMDVNQNQTVDGSLDVSYLNIAQVGMPYQYDSCSIIIGEQQTQN